jgi:phosphatidylglycerophosphate synthase
VLLAINNHVAVIAGLIVFFLKGVLDWSDGLLARVTNRCSDEGAILDSWGAVVNSFGFLIGIGFYLANQSSNMIYIYMMVATILLRAIDLRHFTYSQMMHDMILRNDGGDDLGSGKTKREPVAFGRDGWMGRLRRILTGILDDRARCVDLICLFILVEIMVGRLLITPGVYWIYAVKHLLIFGGGFYLLYFKKLPSQLNNRFLPKGSNEAADCVINVAEAQIAARSAEKCG